MFGIGIYKFFDLLIVQTDLFAGLPDEFTGRI
jgi:hypothetical protein